MSDKPMTDEQRAQLEEISRKSGEEIPGHMTRAEADARIAELRPTQSTSGVDQDAGVGPIDGDEAMDDDTDYRHTPISPGANR
jgi:hypothetical protein